MIEFVNVSASYSDELPVLKDVSFKIDDGQFVAFVGTNGAGKSTTMRLVNGLIKPTAGQVLIDGVPTTELKTSELARQVGFLFQNPDHQICCNTVREELLFGFEAQGRLDDEAQERVDKMIDRFGFDPDAEPYLLNRGTRQLLALASIVVLDPQVVVLDEPTTGLDYRECEKVMDVITEMNNNGATVIMVCHDMEVVADHAKRVIAMTKGEIVADSETIDVLRDRDAINSAHLLEPQIIDIAMRLADRRKDLSSTSICRANTVDEMVQAIGAYKGVEIDEAASSERPSSKSATAKTASAKTEKGGQE